MKLAIDFPEIDLKFMQKTYKETGLTFVPEAIKNECVEAVYKSTPYEERKTGKWKDRSICSCCGWYLKNRFGLAENVNFPYCPHCGAKMEVEDEN